MCDSSPLTTRRTPARQGFHRYAPRARSTSAVQSSTATRCASCGLHSWRRATAPSARRTSIAPAFGRSSRRWARPPAPVRRCRPAGVLRERMTQRRRRGDSWEQLQAWLDARLERPVGPLFCVMNGPTRGRSWSSAAACADLRRTAATAGAFGGASRHTSCGTRMQCSHAVGGAPGLAVGCARPTGTAARVPAALPWRERQAPYHPVRAMRPRRVSGRIGSLWHCELRGGQSVRRSQPAATGPGRALLERDRLNRPIRDGDDPSLR